MVKEVQVSISINNFTAQDYYSTIYAHEEAFQRFHKEHSKDPNAKVSQWIDGSRTVTFGMTLNLPQVMKKAIGTESISVVETQRIQWQGEDKFTVSSQPALNFPGSSNFTTKGHTDVCTQEDTCQVIAIMICETAMAWPLKSTVEAAMATEAQAGVTKFLNFCIQVCEAAKVPRTVSTLNGHASANDRAALPTPPQKEEEEFFDAADEMSDREDLNNQAVVDLRHEGASISSLQSGAGESSAYSALVSAVHPPSHQSQIVSGSTNDALLLAVRELQQTNRATAMVLTEMVSQLQLMNEQVKVIRAVVAPRAMLSKTNSRNALPLIANGDATIDSHPTRTAGSFNYGLWLMSAGLATASAAGVWYLRTHKRSQQH